MLLDVGFLFQKPVFIGLVAVVRSDGYKMLRNISGEAASFADLKLQLLDVEISSLRIGVRSSIAGKSLSQIELRKRSGITVLAIRQNSKILSNPDGDIQLYANDVLFVLGPPEKVAGAMGLFHNPGMD